MFNNTMNDEEVDQCVRKYFAVEEWNNLADILKTRYRNMYRNYKSLPEAAKFLPVPEFMKDNVEEQPSPSSSHHEKQVSGSQKRKVDGENSIQRRNPKRNVPKVDYTEEKEPSDDRYIFCDNCEEVCLDFCSKCGMLKLLKDFPVPMGTDNRARKTVPKGVLEVRPSKIHGLGVFSMRNLRKGIQMGPYQGHMTRVDSTNGYCWKLRNGYLVDAGDEKNSNWLRYVNCARHVDEQNIAGFQYKGRLFYRTVKDIKVGQELLVYYGASFAANLGVDTKKYFQPKEEDVVLEFYTCEFCHIGLSTEEYRDRHQKFCKFRPNRMTVYSNEDTFLCQFCKCSLTTGEFQKKHEKYCRKRPRQEDSSSNKKIFKCHYCDYETIQKPDLKRHILTVHEKENSKVYCCQQCTFKTLYARSLCIHLRVHEDRAVYKCPDCERGFNQKVHLDNHLLNHHNNLQHLITSRINFCKYCTYKTIKSSHLIQHITHNHNRGSAEKFQCRKCDYFALQKGNLKRHLLVHSNLRPYLCTLCKKGYNRKSRLDSHILNNHKENEDLLKSITNKIHQCTFCAYENINRHDLYRHIKSKHKQTST